ncbi:MAG: tetratricopeptide repeat protein [Myxococcales bacterium]|nr:tetratricopeptide repeat protein [Myxococcales bacterium]
MANKKHRGQTQSPLPGTAGGAEIAGGAGTAAGIEQDPTAGWPHDYHLLLERLQSGQLVLCAGAALGASEGRPTWCGIVERLLGRLEPSPEVQEARAMLERHPLTVSGFVRRSLGSTFREVLAEVVPRNGVLPEAVQLLSRLPFRAVLTTAYDDMIERAYAQHGRPIRVCTAYDAAEVLRQGRGRFLLQVFGDPLRSRDVVFGAGDLLRLLADEGFCHLVRDLYHKRSFLFVGFDPRDPDFEILIDRILAAPPPAGSEPRHFAVIPGLSRLARQELEAAFGIRVFEDEDAVHILRSLRDAIGDQDEEILPDEDDLEGWLRLLQQEPDRTDVIAQLEQMEARFRRQRETDRLIELWIGRVEAEGDPRRRAGYLRQVAELLEQDKGQMAEAFHFMLAAYKDAPDVEILDELERLAGTTGQWVELLTALREVMGQLPPEQRADVWVRIARLYGDKLNHLDYALTSLAEAQKLEVADPGTRRQMRELRVELCRRAERWKDLAEALGQLAAEVDDRERRIDLYLEQGDLYEARLADGVSAAAAFRKALEIDPQSRDALTALEHLARRHRDWLALVDVLDRKAQLLEGSGDSEAALQARREAASIATDHLTDRRSAIARWEELRRQAPGDLDALRALEKLYAQQGSYSETYLSVLGDLAEVVSSDKERLALYRRLAAEYEELPGHAAQAAAALERILDIDPTAEDAYRGLERIYRQERKWLLLVDTYRRHAEHVQTGRADIYAAIARIYEVDIPQGHQDQALLAAPQAIEAWNQVLQLEPEHPAALEALSRLYQLTEAFSDAVRILDKRIALAEDKNDKVALCHLAARLTADRLGDDKGAEERFVRALEIDPHHLPSLTALVELYRKGGEYLRAARLLLEAEQHTQNRLDKTRFLVEAAELYAALEDERQAIELYQKALAVDPEHVEAGMRAAELLWRHQRHAELVPILEMLTRKAGERTEQVRLLGRLGQAALATGDRERALRAFARAAELDPRDLLSQRSRAEILAAQQHWMEAREAYAAVLAHHRDALSAGEMVGVLFALGQCERHLGHREQAENFYRKALELDPLHRGSLEALLSLGEVSPSEAVELKRALLATASLDEKVRLLADIGDLHQQALADPQGALSAYREGLALRPDSHLLLHKCLDLLSEQKDWPGVVEILETLVGLEQNPRRRARYRQTMALVARDELKDAARAMAQFQAALDDDPTLERCAVDLEKLALEQQDWPTLARFYRRKIKQLGPDGEGQSREQRAERLRLWTALGEVCLKHLGELESALAAFEVTAALDPDNIERHRLLAGLYVQAGPDRLDKAILEHQTILRLNKGELASYRALKRLYLAARQRDKAAAVASALAILGKSEPEDAELLQELKARPLQPAKRPMPQELWRRLTHPEEDPQLGALFQAVLPVVQLGNARSFKDAGLNRKERLDPQAPQLYAKALRYGVEVLDALVPEVYVQPELRDRPYQVLHCVERGQAPVICVQLGASLLNPKRPEREVMFEIGKLCALLRPKRALQTLLPTAAQLGLLIDAAIALGGELGGAPAKVAETAQGLKRSLAPAVLEQVARYGRTLREAGVRGEAAATTWLGYSDLTAVRAGLVLCGDLETVAMLLATDPPGSSPLSPRQRLLETLHFSVSEDYFAIRQYLGLMG